MFCRSLGFDGNATIIHKAPSIFDAVYSSDYSMFDVECAGDENFLRACDFRAFAGECIIYGNVGLMCGDNTYSKGLLYYKPLVCG